jgi:putative FmdB family regulatory protein
MPLYEYQCEACDARFEVIQKYSDPSADTCRVCGKGPVRRLASSPAIQFKGSGWYITDYAKKASDKGTSASGEKAPDAKAGTDAKGDTSSKTESPAKSDKPAAPAASSTPSSKE